MENEVFEDVQRKYGEPLVFKNLISNWPAYKWTPESLARAVPDKVLQCKVSPIDIEGVQWETESLHVSATLQQYVDWLTGKADPQKNILHNFDPQNYSCYIDYKYMRDMFKDTPALFKDVDWGVFGLDGRDGEDSTIWIGSTGAYTPCHYDTYGFNLVAQLYGSKRWYLLNPEKTEAMYPTRIPYEESSVFSEVNIRLPDLKKHPRFKNMDVYIVDLQPGEALYVPRHWWHFVECLQPAISVNTWIPLQEDGVSHLHEAVSRYLISTMIEAVPNEMDACDLINTNEELQQPLVNLEYLNTAIKNYQNKRKRCFTLTGHCQEDLIQQEQDQRKQLSDGNEENKDIDWFRKFCKTFQGMQVRCKTLQKSPQKRKFKTETTSDCKHARYINDEKLSSESSKDYNIEKCIHTDVQTEKVFEEENSKLEIHCCQKYSFVEYTNFIQKQYDYKKDFVLGCDCYTSSISACDDVASRQSFPETENSSFSCKRVVSANELHCHLQHFNTEQTNCVKKEEDKNCAGQYKLHRCDHTEYDSDSSHEDNISEKNASITHLDVLHSLLHPDVITIITTVLNRRIHPT